MNIKLKDGMTLGTPPGGASVNITKAGVSVIKGKLHIKDNRIKFEKENLLTYT
jgi:hypothetical protein